MDEVKQIIKRLDKNMSQDIEQLNLIRSILGIEKKQLFDENLVSPKVDASWSDQQWQQLLESSQHKSHESPIKRNRTFKLNALSV